MKKLIITICVIGTMLLSSGVSISATNNLTSYGTIHQGFNECPVNITNHEAWDLLTDTNNGIQIPIDVRRESEWNTGYIDTPWPESPIWYTKDLFQNETWLQWFLDTYAGEEIVLYCAGGYRSYLTCLILCDAGFTGTIYNMLGGIVEWKPAGYPLDYYESEPAPVPTEGNVTGTVSSVPSASGG